MPMASTPYTLAAMNRSRTNTWIRVSQGAALTGLVGTGLAVALVGHSPAPVPPAVVQLPAFTPIDEGSQAQVGSASTPGTASRMSLIANRPKAVVAVVQPTPGPPPPPPPPPAPTVTYHGMVTGTAPLALMKDGAKQLFVKVGDIVQGKKVELIETMQVRLGPVDGGTIVPLSDRTGGPVTLATAPSAQAAAAGMPQAIADQRRKRGQSGDDRNLSDFKKLLNPEAQSRLVPAYVDAQDAIFFLFIRDRLARAGDKGMEPEQLDKLAFDQLQNDRDQIRQLVGKQIGEERVDELVKIEGVRQDALREQMQRQGLSDKDSAHLEKFNQGSRP